MMQAHKESLRTFTESFKHGWYKTKRKEGLKKDIE